MSTESAMDTLSTLKEKDKRVIKTHNNRRLENLYCEELRGNSPTFTRNYDQINWNKTKEDKRTTEETRDSKGRLIITIKKD